jgi:ketosteroid isomerase-like protein
MRRAIFEAPLREATIKAAALCVLAIMATASMTVAAAPADVSMAIRATLATWTANFNARNEAPLCSLFAPDLKYDYRGFPERGYTAMCALLHKSVGDPNRRFHYDADIKEIAVSDDMAMTRLVWTLSASRADGSQIERTSEIGMDIFRRQPDGSWKIWRYIAYEAP